MKKNIDYLLVALSLPVALLFSWLDNLLIGATDGAWPYIDLFWPVLIVMNVFAIIWAIRHRHQ